MFDDFLFRAFVAGIGLAIITGPLGCFIVWRRLSYFGDTLAHSALLGVVIAYALSFNIILSVFVISGIISLSLLYLQKKTYLPNDALLGLLAHSVLAIGLVLLGLLTFIRIDLMGLLFGDILSVNFQDILIIWIGGAFVLLILIKIWRPLFAGTVNLDLAKAFKGIAASSGNSFVHETESQVILNGSYNINFTMDLVEKDMALFNNLSKKLNIPLEISPLVLSIFKDAHKKYGSRAWSSMVVKRLEDICKINFRANGYPEELVDNEKEEKGYEI